MHDVQNPTGIPDVLTNTLIQENSQVILAYWHGFVLLDDALNKLKSIAFWDIDDCISLIWIVAENLTKDSFYMSCLADRATPKFKHSYTGTGHPSRKSWVVKSTFNTDDLNFELTDTQENSILLIKEMVRAVYEFASDQLLIYLVTTDLIIVDHM